MMLLLSFLYILSSFILIAGATAIYTGNRRSPKHRAFSLAFTAMACWQQSALLIAQLPSELSKYAFVYGLLPFLYLSLMSMLHAIYLVTGIYTRKYAVLYKLLFLPPVLNMLLFPVPGWLYRGNLQMYDGPQPELGPGGFANMAIMAVYLVVMLAVLLPRALQKHGPSQLWLLGMAGFILFTLGLIFYGEIFRSTDAFALVPFGIDLWAAALYISIYKYDSLPSYEKKYKVLFEKAPIGILIADRAAVIREASPLAAEYLQHPLYQVLGQSIFHWVDHSEKEHLDQQYADRFDRRIPIQDYEVSYLNRESQQVTLSVSSDFIDMEGDVFQLLIMNDITEAKRRERQIHDLAYYDQLTGLHNRASYHQALEEWMEQRAAFVLVVLDLNDFKQINDRYGHMAGDRALRHFADRLRASVGPGDFVARLSGDEFVLLLSRPEDTEPVLRQVEEQLVKPFEVAPGKQLVLTASAGSASYPLDGADPDELFKQADDRMYRMKRSVR